MIRLLEKLKNLNNFSIVAISGFGGSGKTTLSKKIANKLDIQIVHIDDFAITNSSGSEEFSYWNMMDFTRLEQEVLKPFKAKISDISYGKFDWDANEINQNIFIKNNQSIIVEGVGLFRTELLKYFDFCMWVDCDIDEAIFRGMKRDKLLGIDNDLLWNGLWKNNDLDCFENYKPLKIANFIYNNKERKS